MKMKTLGMDYSKKKSWDKPKNCHKIASSKSIKLDFASHSATGYPYIQFLYISSLDVKITTFQYVLIYRQYYAI